MLKKIIAAALFLAATPSFGQNIENVETKSDFQKFKAYTDDREFKLGAVKLNPILAVTNNWHISYELPIANGFSAQASVGFFALPRIYDVKIRGNGGGIGARYYFGETVLQGFYASAWGEYYQVNLLETQLSALGQSTDINASVQVPMGSLGGGYQFVSNGGFTIDGNIALAGFGLRGTLEGFNRSFSQYFGGASPRIGLNIGYAF